MSFTSTSLWRNRDFRIVLVARALCLFGDEAALVALTLRLHDTGGGPALVAALLGAGLLPLVLLAPIAGSLVDRFDSRALLVASSLGSALVCVVLAWTTSPAAVLGLVGLLGAGQAVAGATWQALVPALVGEECVGEAMGLLQAGFTAAGVAAPAVAGLLSGAFGTRLPLLVDAATFVVLTGAALVVRTRRVPERDPGAKVHARDGLDFLRRDPVVAPLVLSLGVFVLLGMMGNVVQVFLVRDTLGSTATWYGMVAAAWAVGCVAGALHGGRRRDELARVRAIRVATAVLALSLLGFAGAPGVWFLVPVSLVGGTANGVLNACAGAVIIVRAPEQLRGRVAAALGAVVSGASLLSLLLGGVLAGWLSPREVFLVTGVAALGSALATGPRAVRAARVSSGTGVVAAACSAPSDLPG